MGSVNQDRVSNRGTIDPHRNDDELVAMGTVIPSPGNGRMTADGRLASRTIPAPSSEDQCR